MSHQIGAASGEVALAAGLGESVHRAKECFTAQASPTHPQRGDDQSIPR
ncbi:hypothetical protein [Neorhodopirellula lusitana]|nr:hypothetical protein [Neorhodopirellula lusitana]